VLDNIKSLPSEGNPKQIVEFLMGKESELRSKPDTSLIPQENMKACNQPLFKCVWSWGDGSYTAHGIGGSKKLAEHTAAQMMLAAMFPHDWSFGYMYEYTVCT
jgi:dsRNA-specific ribonuclease